MLSYGYATVRKIDIRVFRALHAFLLTRYLIQDVINRYAIETSILIQTMGLMGGTLTKYLLSNGIEIINRIGSDNIMITIIIIVMIETSIAIMNTGNDIIFTSE